MHPRRSVVLGGTVVSPQRPRTGRLEFVLEAGDPQARGRRARGDRPRRARVVGPKRPGRRLGPGVSRSGHSEDPAGISCLVDHSEWHVDWGPPE